jgi:hypothetical protein
VKTTGPSPPPTLEGEFMTDRLIDNIDKAKLERLLVRFRDSVKRDVDRGLADEIQRQILDSDYPWLTTATTRKLARWCKTNGTPYQEAMPVAQQISEVLFGTILDRTLLNT